MIESSVDITSEQDWWAKILSPTPTPYPHMRRAANVLAQHPDTHARTQELLRALTNVKPFIEIANKAYNRLQDKHLARRPGGETPTDFAWRRLREPINMRWRNSDGSKQLWLITAELLDEGSREGLADIRALPIEQVIAAGAKLIKFVYYSPEAQLLHQMSG